MFVEDEEAALVSAIDLVHSCNEITYNSTRSVHCTPLILSKPIPIWDSLLAQAYSRSSTYVAEY